MARKMKDSGIEFIEKIPFDWHSIKLKYCTYIRARLGWKALKADEYVESGYPLLSAFNIINNSLQFINLNYINQFRYDESPEIQLSVDDILLVKDGAGIGKCAIVENLPVSSTVNGSIAVITATDFLVPKYLYYYFLSPIFQQHINFLKDGMGVPHLFQADLKEIEVVFPNKSEQIRLITYLDLRCFEIDAILFKARSSIEEYKKLKQAVITQAVTKGVRGEREMKPTGFPRWSEIPFDWDLKRVKSCVASITSGLSAVTDDANSEESGNFVLRTSAVSSGFFIPTEVKPVLKSAVNRLICPVEPDTLIVSRMNTASMVGACAYVANNYPNTFLPDKLWKIKFHPRYHTKYMWYALNSVPAKSWFSELATGASSSMQNISISDFTSNYLPIPAFSEQEEIADYLDAKCAEIDRLIAKKEQLVKELESYKKSLIYEVVTGKREV